VASKNHELSLEILYSYGHLIKNSRADADLRASKQDAWFPCDGRDPIGTVHKKKIGLDGALNKLFQRNQPPARDNDNEVAPACAGKLPIGAKIKINDSGHRAHLALMKSAWIENYSHVGEL